MNTQIHTSVLTEGPGYGGSSTSTLTLAGSGSLSFTMQAGLAYVTGSRVRVYHDSTHYMEGVVTTYNFTTGATVVALDFALGTGSFSTWNITLAGNRGGVSVGGASGDIQYNDGASGLAATANLHWDATNGVLTLGSTRGTVQLNDANSNLYIGYQTGSGSGANNLAMGYQALHSQTTGNTNIAIGLLALTACTSGELNVLIGALAGQAITTSTEITGVGYRVLTALTTGLQNDAFGTEVLFQLTTGSFNTAIGTGAMENCIIGNYNTALGNHALHGVLGDGNVGIGRYAGFYATGSNEFYLSNVDQSSNALEKVSSLLYGVFDGRTGGVSGNALQVNGNLRIYPTANHGLVIGLNNGSSSERDWGCTASFVTPGDFALCQGTAQNTDPFAPGSSAIRVYWNAAGLMHILNTPVYANNAAALAGGLIVGGLYRTGANPDPVCIVH